MRVIDLRTGGVLFERTTGKGDGAATAGQLRAARHAERTGGAGGGGGSRAWWGARWWVGAGRGAVGFVEAAV